MTNGGRETERRVKLERSRKGLRGSFSSESDTLSFFSSLPFLGLFFINYRLKFRFRSHLYPPFFGSVQLHWGWGGGGGASALYTIIYPPIFAVPVTLTIKRMKVETSSEN